MEVQGGFFFKINPVSCVFPSNVCVDGKRMSTNDDIGATLYKTHPHKSCMAFLFIINVSTLLYAVMWQYLYSHSTTRSIHRYSSRWSSLSIQQQDTCALYPSSLAHCICWKGNRQKSTMASSNDTYGAVRPVPIHICTTTSSGKNDTSQQYIQEWLAKVSRYTKVESVTFKPNPLRSKSSDVARQEESKRLIKYLAKSSQGSGSANMYVVCLDERGRDVDSRGMADILVKASDQGYGSIAFVIGGPFGHDKDVREISDDTIRLSRCVLNHSVACVVLVEQLYRAWTIIKGEPYHH
jgi:23S rRNA (pseudouridine1915-N3)-methyltransferase